MPVLADIFSAADAFKRNLKDFIQNPGAVAERQIAALRNTNRGQRAIATPESVGMVGIPREEQVGAMSGAALDTLSGGLGVIKPKGGNWLSSKYGVEERLKSLRRYAEPSDMAHLERNLANPESAGIHVTPEVLTHWQNELNTLKQHEATNSFIDRQLTKYIKNDMASPADPIRQSVDAWQAEKAIKLAQAEARVNALRQKQQAQAATRGVPEEYLTQTRQDILKAEEARDLIAENTGLHTELADVNPRLAANMRRHAGFAEEGAATTPLGKLWENQMDTELVKRPASDFQLANNLSVDPWLAKVEPSTQIYALSPNQISITGFPHLIDELANSLREGRLTPEQLGKMPIDQAVRHVAEINALRKVNTNKALAADMEGMPVHIDYPEQGMSWRQLQSQDKDQLQKWLTQEGDAMGHCVGGYCDDVASGQSNIYSLRDTKGKPYATIETGAGGVHEDLLDQAIDAVPPDMPYGTQEYEDFIETEMAYLREKAAKELAPSILQIKGPSNASPDPKYFPLIQDFIKKGKWSDIQDIEHTGLSNEEINKLLGR